MSQLLQQGTHAVLSVPWCVAGSVQEFLGKHCTSGQQELTDLCRRVSSCVNVRVALLTWTYAQTSYMSTILLWTVPVASIDSWGCLWYDFRVSTCFCRWLITPSRQEQRLRSSSLSSSSTSFTATCSVLVMLPWLIWLKTCKYIGMIGLRLALRQGCLNHGSYQWYFINTTTKGVLENRNQMLV